jgi:hypothetical protein
MRRKFRTWAVLTASALALGAAFLAPEARAQNTYADVPFNQGSLFYRPSGARPPRVVTRDRVPRRVYRRPYFAAPRYRAYSPYSPGGYGYSYAPQAWPR